MNKKKILPAAVKNDCPPEHVEIPDDSKPGRRVLDGITELYRHFDEWGRLLYVGVSSSSVQRLWEHRETSNWSNLISTITIERFPSRAHALAAEKAAIQSEKPYFNRVHAGLWHLRKWEHPYQKYADNVCVGLVSSRTGVLS